MPKLNEYLSKGELRPTSEGYSAAETAARRVGPLAQQEAADVEKQGRMQAETAGLQTKFAFEFTEPYASLTGRGRGGGVSTRGAGSVSRTLIGTGTNAGITRNAPEIARGAARLARTTNALTPSSSYDNTSPLGPNATISVNGVQMPIPPGFTVNSEGDLVLTQAGFAKAQMQERLRQLIDAAQGKGPKKEAAGTTTGNTDWEKVWADQTNSLKPKPPGSSESPTSEIQTPSGYGGTEGKEGASAATPIGNIVSDVGNTISTDLDSFKNWFFNGSQTTVPTDNQYSTDTSVDLSSPSVLPPSADQTTPQGPPDTSTSPSSNSDIPIPGADDNQ